MEFHLPSQRTSKEVFDGGFWKASQWSYSRLAHEAVSSMKTLQERNAWDFKVAWRVRLAPYSNLCWARQHVKNVCIINGDGVRTCEFHGRCCLRCRWLLGLHSRIAIEFRASRLLSSSEHLVCVGLSANATVWFLLCIVRGISTPSPFLKNTVLHSWIHCLWTLQCALQKIFASLVHSWFISIVLGQV